MVYAIVRAGGRQEKVAVGDVLEIDRLHAEPGASVELPVLLLVDGETVTSDKAALAKATVTVEVVAATKGPKIDILKYKNKTGYRKRQGHRQKHTAGQGHRHRDRLRPVRLTSHGSQEGRLVHPQRARLQRAAARRQALRRPGRQRRRDHRPPARHPLPPRPEVGRGGDDTLFALIAGAVEFGTRRGRRVVNIVPAELAERHQLTTGAAAEPGPTGRGPGLGRVPLLLHETEMEQP